MAQFSQFYLTNLGKGLIAQAQGDTDKLIFTKMVTSDKQYTENQIPTLTKIEQIKQQKGIGGIKYIPPDVVEINTLIDGMDVTAGYYIMSVAIFAKTEQENKEKLFAVCFILDSSKADWMSPNGSLNQMSINITARFITGNAQVTSITTVPDGTVSIDVFNQHTNDKNAHGATYESNINTIISRNELGYSKIKSPNYEEAEDEHIMNKKSTTEAINNKTSTLATKSELQTELAKKQNKLNAGTNIEITEDNTINATGGGTSIELSQDIETDKLNTEKVPSTKAVYDFMSWVPKDIISNQEFDTGKTIDGKKIYGIYLTYTTAFNISDKNLFYIPPNMTVEIIETHEEYRLNTSCYSYYGSAHDTVLFKYISFGMGSDTIPRIGTILQCLWGSYFIQKKIELLDSNLTYIDSITTKCSPRLNNTLSYISCEKFKGDFNDIINQYGLQNARGKAKIYILGKSSLSDNPTTIEFDNATYSNGSNNKFELFVNLNNGISASKLDDAIKEMEGFTILYNQVITFDSETVVKIKLYKYN